MTGRATEYLCTTARLACVLIGLTGLTQAVAFDIEAFNRLDPAELRAAEAAMHEYLEPGSARLLREPRNDAERYVVQRQQRLAAQLQQRPTTSILADGTEVTQIFWPLARATQVGVDHDGRITFHCVSVAERLTGPRPDFRMGNDEKRAIR
jgi:hypothetical protein